MNRRDADHPDPRLPLEHNALESVIHRELSRPCAGPDLTDSIMRRLGYRRADARGRRRQTWQRWGRRLSVAAAASVALLVGVFVHQAGPDARHAAGINFPSAIENDLSRHERSVGQLIQTIRQLTPPASSLDTPPALNEPDEPARAPSDQPPSSGSTMDPAAAAPFQWV